MSNSFADLGVPALMVQALTEAGITQPTPIQTAAIADSLAGHDISGRAPTGSGKTLAFAIPLVHRITKAESCRPTALILVPTRELAAQVQNALVPIAKAQGRWVLAVYGGAGFSMQASALRRGIDILVACPGRLADLIRQGAVKLDRVEVAVIDEADRMADMGFMPQVRELLDQTPSTRQTILYSATLDGDVDQLVRRYQKNPIRHDVAGDIEQGEMVHLFNKVQPHERITVAAQLVRKHGPTVIFTRTRHGADRLSDQLEVAGVTSSAIHGALTQAQREGALRSFKNGHVKALVATDVAARGIHVDAVGLVIHWDLPEDPKDYIHRSGRTARAGATGVVVSLVTPQTTRAALTLARKVGIHAAISDPDLSGPDFVFPEATGVDRNRFSAAERAAKAKPRFERNARAERASSFGTPRFDGNPRPEPARDRSGRPGAGANRTERQAYGAAAGRPSSAGTSRPAGARPGVAAKPSGPARGKVKRNRGF
jgi:superfamily II DNA/RNA helicase